MDAFEREEAAIWEAVDNGEITQAQGMRELKDLHDSVRAGAEEAAQQAYDNEMGRW